MNLDVYADLADLLMLNFSVPAGVLQSMVPPPLRVLVRHGRGFPSIVLPSIRNLRPVRLGFPSVDYELCGLRVLVEFRSRDLGWTRGIYFVDLILEPNWLRVAANWLTPFGFRRGSVRKTAGAGSNHEIEVIDAAGDRIVRARVTRTEERPNFLPPGSCFESPKEALALYDEAAVGLLRAPVDGRIEILQITEPHPDYVASPLRHLVVHEAFAARLHQDPSIQPGEVTLEPSYAVGPLPRYWRWLVPATLEAETDAASVSRIPAAAGSASGSAGGRFRVAAESERSCNR